MYQLKKKSWRVGWVRDASVTDRATWIAFEPTWA